MKSTMGVTKVRDRRDIFEKYHRLIESLWTKPRAVSWYDLPHPDPTARADEFQADRLGLEIQAAAGYDPMAPIRLFDRLAETRGKTGNFISNFFNYTPDEKRLGLMLKNKPTDCALAPAQGSAEFLQWRERVLGNTSVRFPESLVGTLSRRMLTFQIQEEEDVISHEATPCQDLDGEEIRSRQNSHIRCARPARGAAV